MGVAGWQEWRKSAMNSRLCCRANKEAGLPGRELSTKTLFGQTCGKSHRQGSASSSVQATTHFPALGTFTSEEFCTLCNTPNASLQHILSGCKIALFEGRNRWQDDQVLRKRAKVLWERRQGSKGSTTADSPHHTSFVREGGGKRNTRFKETSMLFSPNKEWEMGVGTSVCQVRSQLHFSTLTEWCSPPRRNLCSSLSSQYWQRKWSRLFTSAKWASIRSWLLSAGRKAGAPPFIPWRLDAEATLQRR